MKEIVFLNNNAHRWKQFEKVLRNSSGYNSDTLADLFIQITDDLAYALTYYPNTKTAIYLNSLALKAHLLIYKNKKEKGNRFVSFWKYEVPLAFWENRKNFFYALIIFVISILIGVVSSANDPTFVRLILGDGYVNMTLENIKKGDPMAVYKNMEQTEMFFMISMNNIMVSFKAFVFGVLVSLGTVAVLFFNGVMLGSFQYFFHAHGILYESVLTIWIHGTLEIFAIIVAGGAGLSIGNSILFPGTYSRLQSFKISILKSVKIAVGLVPVFLVAGFLESFVTRMTEWPDFVRLGIIGASLAFIVWYFFIYPYRMNKAFFKILIINRK